MGEVIGNNLVVILFAGIFFGLVAGILATLFAKMLQGRVDIHLNKKIFSYGETIEGNVIIDAKKSLSVQDIEIHLIGYKQQKVKSTKGVHYSHTEVYRHTEKLGSSQLLAAKSQKEIVFELSIPKIEAFEEEMQEYIQQKLEKNAEFLADRPKRNTTKLRWNLRLDVDCEGLDLTRHRKIRIEK